MIKSNQQKVLLAFLAISFVILILKLHERKDGKSPARQATERSEISSNKMPELQTPSEQTKPALLDKSGRLSKAQQINTSPNVPVYFYGKIIDQNEQPVANAIIVLSYNYWGVVNILIMRASEYTNILYSSALGEIKITNVTGNSIALDISKEGYFMEPHPSLVFSKIDGHSSITVGTPEKPIIYHMWKRLGEAPLINQSFQKSVKADGSSVSLDMSLDGPILGRTNFDFPTVQIWRDPLNLEYGKYTPTRWRYEVNWSGAAFKLTDDLFCYAAPENGYQDKLAENSDTTIINYPYEINRQFYFKDPQGRYGHGVLNIRVDYGEEKSLAEFVIWWNPDGTRNLEPKP